MDPHRTPANHLITEKSPYLLQHAHNPVEWYPWGDAAFEKSVLEDKPILLSIGYSTCHWCHVMERESFTDPHTAAVMNRNFVNIKVDREERPDIDTIYMTAVSALTGSGGWPLNVFLTPDGRPFFGGTYFPPRSRPGMPGWKALLDLISEAWNDPEKRRRLTASGEEISGIVARFLADAPTAAEPDAGIFDAARRDYAERYDAEQGGFGGAPKFPSPSIQNFLLADAVRRGNAAPVGGRIDPGLAMAIDTLRAMARGGIYDILGGGFHRYATDARWHVPHFEKMLYDNAQLIVTYAEAYRMTRDGDFARVARETADYVLRDLTHPEGGFFSAEDADSPVPGDPAGNAAEGAFYVWRYAEVFDLLGEPDAAVFAHHFGLMPGGNVAADPHGAFTGKNILYTEARIGDTASRFGQTPEAVATVLARCRRRLFDARNRRPRPHLDDKVLCSWNGLMIGALARLHQAVGDETYLTAARRGAQFVWNHMYDMDSARLYRRWRSGERKVPGLADDYAFYIQGLIDLFESDFDPEWLNRAAALSDEQLGAFYDGASGSLYMTRKDHDRHLLLRVREDSDNVLPSAASVTALNLLRLSRLTGRADFDTAAGKILKSAQAGLQRHPTAAPQMLVALDFYLAEPIRVIVSGDPEDHRTRQLLKTARDATVPGKTLLYIGSPDNRKSLAKHLRFIENIPTGGGEPAAWVCSKGICREPVADPARLGRLLADRG